MTRGGSNQLMMTVYGSMHAKGGNELTMIARANDINCCNLLIETARYRLNRSRLSFSWNL